MSLIWPRLSLVLLLVLLAVSSLVSSSTAGETSNSAPATKPSSDPSRAASGAVPSAGVVPAPGPAQPPKTPPGMQACVSPLAPATELPRTIGETIRYNVDVNGMSVGTVDFRIERHGAFGSSTATEYRSVFKIDSLVATLVPAEGRAASVVSDRAFWPTQAMNRYRMEKNDFEESQTYASDGQVVRSHRLRNGKPSDDSRAFPGPAHDFVSGFYFLRSLPVDAQGCAIVYGNQRAYTFWIKPDGEEKIMTPVGLKPTRRYIVTYASEKAKLPSEVRIWLSEGPERLVYKAEMVSGGHIEANIHLYETGKS